MHIFLTIDWLGYMGYGFEILINQFPQINTTHTERLIKMYYIAFCYLLFSTTKTVSKSIIFDDFYSFRIGTRHGSVFNSGQFTNQTRERWFFLVPVNVVASRWRVLSSPSSRMPAWLLEIQPSCVKVKTKIASEKNFRNFWEWNQKKSKPKTATYIFAGAGCHILLIIYWYLLGLTVCSIPYSIKM